MVTIPFIILLIVTAFILFLIVMMYKLIGIEREYANMENEEKLAREHALNVFENICKKEDIPLTYVEGPYQSGSDMACGTYTYKSCRGNWLTPVGIKVDGTSESKVFILAHELGHHFCMKLYNDNSESSADRYIKTLFKEHVPEKHVEVLKMSIGIYSTPHEATTIAA
jgi:hypothetical protein